MLEQSSGPVQMMELVELTPLRDLLVGSPAETGLSVEQRKRLSIAVELISNPAIVLMDEPTSGASIGKPAQATCLPLTQWLW